MLQFMKLAPRGRFKTLVQEDGSPVGTVLRTTVSRAPKVSGGKTYVILDVPEANRSHMALVDDCIKAYQPGLEYSPLLNDGMLLVAKIASNALADTNLESGDLVEAHMKLGNFGSFGYCWIVSNIFKVQTRDV